MPDQSRAAEEHALLAEISGELQELPPNENLLAGEVDFPVVLRGYDRIAVDAYLRRLTRRLSDLEANRSPDSAVRRALERVGEEVSGILQRAHETADQITSQSRSEAEDRLESARLEAAQITARARERLRELDTETDRIWSERMRILEDVRNLSAELVKLSDEAAERFPAASDTGETVAVTRESAGAFADPEDGLENPEGGIERPTDVFTDPEGGFEESGAEGEGDEPHTVAAHADEPPHEPDTQSTQVMDRQHLDQ